MPSKYPTIMIALLCYLSASCSVQLREGTLPAATPLPATATRPATETHTPSQTVLTLSPHPAPATATQMAVTPVNGVTSTQVNVRAEPSTAGSVLGVIPAEMRVEITGKDPGENWWQINYPHPDAVDGKGWVTAQYVIASNPDQVPTIGAGAETDGTIAVVQEQINVRSGPGTDFNSLGTLNPQDVVQLTGKDANGAWLQIDFQAGDGPDGRGWVSAAFVQARGVEDLPIITEAGIVVGTGTPTVIPPTPTATIVPAPEDHDSPANPIVRVIFEPGGTQALLYNGDLSSPRGDAEDWIAFTPDGPYVFVSLECRGNGSAGMVFLEGTVPVTTGLECGNPVTRVNVNPGSSYLVHVQSALAPGELQYVNYRLTIKSRP